MMNLPIQKGILEPIPPAARYLFLDLIAPAELSTTLAFFSAHFAAYFASGSLVWGVGDKVLKQLKWPVSLGYFPHSRNHPKVATTPHDLVLWVRGADAGEVFHLSQLLTACLKPAFSVASRFDCFKYKEGHDLTGYEDGTENPQGIDATLAAAVTDTASKQYGASFAAFQLWQHDFDVFNDLSEDEQNDSIGRHKITNEELDDASISAHVKRTAQENFSPEAYLLRRSMPWIEGNKAGLMFAGFGHSTHAFEAQLNRMMGKDDGIIDALFNFSQPVTGGYYWCPPMGWSNTPS